MRKIILFLGICLLTFSLSAQTILTKGMAVGKTAFGDRITVDSIISTTGLNIQFYSGATQLSPVFGDSVDISTIAIMKADSGITYKTPTEVNTSIAGIDDQDIVALQAMGSSIKAMSVGVPTSSANNASSLGDGYIYLIPVYLKKAATITGVMNYIATQGVYTADNNNRVGLYTVSGGTATLVASSANDGNLWKATSNTFIKTAFSSPYVAAAGPYYVGLVFNNSAQTTAPQIPKGTNLVNLAFASLDFTNSNTLGCFNNATTNLTTPITMSGMTNLVNTFWVAIY